MKRKKKIGRSFFTRLRKRKTKLNPEMLAIRQASGMVRIDSNLVGFLYVLMRDHLTPGVIEEIVNNHCQDSDNLYCNGWLAKYAEYVATRLKEKE